MTKPEGVRAGGQQRKEKALAAYSGDGEHPFQLKPSSRSGHGEQSERQRRWDVLSLHLLASLR
ncbi:hypothetical protein, partial [Myxococcus qinghaiensis]|uniref:hypothetical protein n=1 Tax=Myxococcus qinghaiensis TaxID=2906758 RepID=UPI0020A6E06E